MGAKEDVVAAMREFGWNPGEGPVPVDMERVRGLSADLMHMAGDSPVCAMVAGPITTNEFPGVTGVEDAWRDWLATFEDYSLEATALEVRPIGVVGLGRQRGRSAHAGIQIEHEAGVLILMPDDRIERVEFHLHHDTTLAAADAAEAAQSGQE